ncbi:FAD-binding FR-type domain-containing protein [Mycena venus]|uniref:FAD-binding FR-type domain-containing protein n=1 Tax=Mycena venus TaxID=2733690 RepID=A0A8H6X3Y6_9AGAR|nr:FAD-binding FR-type domain-containing protein [Mycena venus]
MVSASLSRRLSTRQLSPRTEGIRDGSLHLRSVCSNSSGGSGVSFALPLFLHLFQAARDKRNPCCQRIVLVWAIRDPDRIIWIAEAVTHALWSISSGSAPDIDIRLYVTTAAEETQTFDGEECSSVATGPEVAAETVVCKDPNQAIARAEKMDPSATQRLLTAPRENLIYGRPDIEAILSDRDRRDSGISQRLLCSLMPLSFFHLQCAEPPSLRRACAPL